MPNKVEAGMRFRRRDDGKTFTAVREWGKGRSGINGQPDWYVEEDDSHRSLSSDVMYEPIPEPAPELCAYPGCDELLSHNVHRCTRYCTNFGIDRCPRNTMRCHDFIAPQAKPLIAKPLIAKPTDVYAGPPITGTFHNVQAKPVLREPMPEEVMPAVCGLCGRGYIDAAEHADWHVRITPCMTIPATAENTRSLRERGPSAVAAAPGIEPWRPSVDEYDLLPNAVEGWRR